MRREEPLDPLARLAGYLCENLLLRTFIRQDHGCAMIDRVL
jgi:hypothetical protein